MSAFGRRSGVGQGPGAPPAYGLARPKQGGGPAPPAARRRVGG